MTTIATTRATHVPAARHAAVREALAMIVEGDTPLAVWSLRWHTEHLAELSDSPITLDEAWTDYCMCLARMGAA